MAKRRRRPRNKNRTWDAPTHVWVLSTRVAAFVLIVVIGVVTYAVLKHHCGALQRDILRLETEQRRLVDELKKERTRWSEMKRPANLVKTLYRHGIAMEHPSAQQLVYMEPMPGWRRGPAESTGSPVYASK